MSMPPISSSIFLAISRMALRSSRLHSYAAIVGPTFSCSCSLWSGPIPFTLLHRNFILIIISSTDLKSLSTQITEQPPFANSSARDSPRVDETPAICYRKHLSTKKVLLQDLNFKSNLLFIN